MSSRWKGEERKGQHPTDNQLKQYSSAEPDSESQVDQLPVPL